MDVDGHSFQSSNVVYLDIFTITNTGCCGLLIYWPISIWNKLSKSNHFWNSGLHQIMPHGICYSHYGDWVRNGAISIAQWGLPHCSRIDLNKILFPGTFFTSPHSYLMGTISICKKIWDFTENFWENSKFVKKKIFLLNFI